MFGGIEPLEGCDGDDPHRFLSFVEKYCPNHYDEAVALFEKDLANCKGEFGYSSFDMTDFIERAGTPVGMKCVYYEWERDDMYAGVMIHSGSQPFGVFKIISVPSDDDPNIYNVYHNPDISEYAFDNDCYEYEPSDPTGMNALQEKVREYNEFCRQLDNVTTHEELRALGTRYRVGRYKTNVKCYTGCKDAKGETSFVEIQREGC
jgi:hypothetical protein